LRQRTSVESLNNLALVLEAQGQNESAERDYKLAISLAEKLPTTVGDIPVGRNGLLARTLENYAALLIKLKRPLEASKARARARELAGRHSEK